MQKVKLPASEDFREKILARLAERGIKPQCEVCGHNNWAVVDQPITIVVTGVIPGSSGRFPFSPPQIPAAGLICNNCGNVRLFALGALGL